jgi:outer membrane receptor for ferrienterochelin and colicins
MWSFLVIAIAAQVPLDGGTDGGVEEELERQRITVVTGSRTERRAADTIVPTEVITRQQIEQLGVRDLPQLLQQHPGVEMVYTNRGTGIRLQGLDPEYVLILVDGQRISGRSGSITDISRFSLREVERVEIVKGPGAVRR